jgi:photosystem II stability/assembly factor-like uncharacterized protein
MDQHTFSKKLHTVAWVLLLSLGSCLAPLAGPIVPQDTDFLSSEIFKSTDSGATWSVVNSGLPCVTVYTMAVDPLTPGTLYAGTDRGVFKSTDGGENWVVPNGIITLLGAFSLAIHPDNSSIIYAAGGSVNGGGHGVLKSTDAGASWSPVNTGLGEAFVWDLIIDSTNPSTLYVMSYRGVYKSIDAGGHWNVVLPFFIGGDVAYPQSLEIDQHNPLKLYATRGTRFSKTIDAGSTWKDAELTFDVGRLTIDPSNPSVLYIVPTPPTKLYRSTDAGNSWASIIETQDWFSGFVVNPMDSSTLYLGSPQGVLKSADGGINWVKTTFPVKSASRLILHPARPSTMYDTNGLGKRPFDTPWIVALYLEGKRLTVSGEYFDAGAKILLDGEEQKTKNNDAMPTRVLIGKKAGKKVKRDPSRKIQVRNSDGKLSQEVTFFPPIE